MDSKSKVTAIILVLLLAACNDEPFDEFGSGVESTDSGTAENHQWPLSLESEVWDMVVDEVGNLYITGSYEGQAVFGGTTLTSEGDGEGYLAKLTPAGEFLWAISFGGPGGANGWRLALGDDGSIIVAGCFWNEADFGVKTVTSISKGDGFVAKLAADKTFEWVTTIDGLIQRIAVDGAGNTIVIARHPSQDSFGDITIADLGERDIVAKLDPDGNFTWVTPVGGIGQNSDTVDYATLALEVDSADNAYIAGAFRNASMSLTLGDITLTEEGGSMYVAKLSQAGEFLSAKSASAVGSEGDVAGVGIRDIALDKSGNIYTTGVCTGTASFDGIVVSCPDTLGNWSSHVAKLSADDTFAWATSVGETGRVVFERMSLDPQGNVYALGHFEDNPVLETGTLANKGEEDLLVAKLSPEGELLWVKSAGGGLRDTAMNMAVDHTGEVYVTGWFKGNAVFDGVVLSAPEGQRNSFIWRVEQLE